MFSFDKKIIYLSFIRDGVKEGNAGFVRLTQRDEECRIDMQLKKVPGTESESCPVYFITETGNLFLGEIVVQAGSANVSRYLKVNGDYLEWSGERVLQENVCGIMVGIGPNVHISGYWKEPESQSPEIVEENMADREKEAEPLQKVTEMSMPMRQLEQTPKPDVAAANYRNKMENSISDDKWEQLLKSFPQIHPFGDERTFISVEPKDFVILRAAYQKLVNNSFLLHGFYNYRYLILGQDAELGGKEGDCFYIGVPGTYFEREKMVAVMFGFEGFECNGAVEVGKFGYYMRKVEL